MEELRIAKDRLGSIFYQLQNMSPFAVLDKLKNGIHIIH